MYRCTGGVPPTLGGFRTIFFFLADGSKACGEGELELVCVKAQRGLNTTPVRVVTTEAANSGAKGRMWVHVHVFACLFKLPSAGLHGVETQSFGLFASI